MPVDRPILTFAIPVVVGDDFGQLRELASMRES
jgi:hypothetical protein